jgi:hypothetical protein
VTRHAVLLLAILTLVLSPTIASAAAYRAVPVELRGSRASMERQNAVVLKGGFTFARSFADIDRMVATGELVRLHGNDHYVLRSGLRSDAARPEMRLLVERLAKEYYTATGEKLVVTSLTRPSSAQPRNASALSVHPTGLALDLRISQKAASRQWIEKRLLGMEALGLLDVTRELHPPHYHVALFPSAYLAYVEGTIGAEALALELKPERDVEPAEEDLIGQPLHMELVMVSDDEPTTPERRSPWSFITVIIGLWR